MTKRDVTSVKPAKCMNRNNITVTYLNTQFPDNDTDVRVFSMTEIDSQEEEDVCLKET